MTSMTMRSLARSSASACSMSVNARYGSSLEPDLAAMHKVARACSRSLGPAQAVADPEAERATVAKRAPLV